MIEDILKNSTFRRIFPPVAGLAFITLFISLALWQLDRAEQKEALLAQFAADAPFMSLNGQLPERPFQPVEARGRFLGEHQVLIENIVREGRLGFFVITPFQQSGNDPLILVNRGWMPRAEQVDERALTQVNDDVRTIRGRSGHLPRVGLRAGPGFEGATDWPKHTTYPTLEEVAAELDEEVSPFVILLDPREEDGFSRQWQPRPSGPMTNYGYAFQWFAMATAVLVILVWTYRKDAGNRNQQNDRDT